MLTGVVLCGGQSKRMGREKSLIIYFDEPQYLHVAGLLQPSCEQVVISCRTDQKELFHGSALPIVLDSLMDAGPAAGLLAAFDAFPHSSFLVAGCDYPDLRTGHLQMLLAQRNPGKDAVCFETPEGIEPLVAIYEQSMGAKLRKQLAQKQYSLKRLLENSDTRRIPASSAWFPASVDR